MNTHEDSEVTNIQQKSDIYKTNCFTNCSLHISITLRTNLLSFSNRNGLSFENKRHKVKPYIKRQKSSTVRDS